jgi:hypothetical protein
MVSELVAVPILLVTLGFVGIYTGWKRRRVHARMAAVTPTPVVELASPGVVEVEGTARPVDDGTAAVRVDPVSKRDTAGKWTQTTGVSAADGVRIDAVLTGPDDGLFVLSNQEEASLEAEFESSARARFVGGVVSLALGLGGLAYVFLPV